MKSFNYGENLRKIRQEKGISQFAMATCLNISQPSYSRLEAQSGMFDNEMLYQLAKALEIPIIALLPISEPNNAEAQEAHRNGLLQGKLYWLNSPIGWIMYISMSLFLANVVYELSKGFFEGLGTSKTTKYLVSATMACMTIGWFIYLARKVRKRSS